MATKKPTWNNEQALAINADLGNFLISASAGSGKTAVLTERVYRLIKSGTNLDKLLILTFTNFAASNMRDKIRDKLIEDNLIELASMLESVNIQTFDAFALFLVKKYYYRLGLKSDIKLVDEAIIKLEENKILTDIFNHRYENKDKDFIEMISTYSIKDDSNITDLVFKIFDKLSLSIDKKETLNDYRNTFLSPEYINNVVNNYFKEAKRIIEKDYELAKTFTNTDFGDLVVGYFESLDRANSYDELHAKLYDKNNEYPRTAKGKKSLQDYPEDKVLNEILKNSNAELKSAFEQETLEDLINQIIFTKSHIEILLDIVKELDDRLLSFKNEHSVYTFNDIFKFAIKLASIPDINNDLRNQFKYIMIDEYQDTSDLQEIFISLFANNNVFSVGDVKQSIYRFRNANPDIFLGKFVKYGKHQDGERIDLPMNYRSSKEVLDTVNEVFRVIMNKEDTGLDYKNEHEMVSGNPNINKNKTNTDTVLNEIVYYDLPENVKQVEYEARLIATDILRRIENKEQILTKEGYKEISYKNFAILIAKKTNFNIFQKVFEQYQIPLFANYDQPIHESDLTLVLESIIKALSYLDDISSNEFRHAIFSILRSFLYQKDEEYIEDLLHSEKYEKCEAYISLTKIKSLLDSKTSLKEVIINIIEEFNFNEKIILIGDISHCLDILSNYIDIASNMDELGYDLKEFNQYFEELKEFDIEPEFNASSSLEDSVKLMSVHASKGLEFNYVYLPCLDSKGAGGSIDRFFVSSKYGVILPNYHFKHANNFYHYLAAKEEKRENLLEKMRLFYVALTRAQEKLIFLVNNAKVKEKEPILENMKTFLDMVLMANPKLFKLSIIPTEPKEKEEEERIVSPVTIKNISPMDQEIKEHRRASKDSDSDDIDTKLLELGNKYHYYLELVDFKTKDTSFIKNEKDRRRIESFLANDVFETKDLVNVAHEYKFYDEINDIHGAIDLLLVYKDHVSIIDFKLSKVSDELYARQVDIYKDYIKQITNLPIKTYIAGILSYKINEVK